MAPPPLPQDYTAPSNTYATPSTPLNTFGTTSTVDDWNADPWSGVSAGVAPVQQTQDWQADVSFSQLYSPGIFTSQAEISTRLNSKKSTPSQSSFSESYSIETTSHVRQKVFYSGPPGPRHVRVLCALSSHICLQNKVIVFREGFWPSQADSVTVQVETGVLLGGIPSIPGTCNGVKYNLPTPSPTGVQVTNCYHALYLPTIRFLQFQCH